MNAVFGVARDAWNGFIDNVARALEAFLARFGRQRRATIVESAPGRFEVFAETRKGRSPVGDIVLDARGTATGPRASLDAVRGGRLSLILDESRFLIRDFPLPAQAGEFLDRILRNQIDRLTPWHGDRAMFGHARREGTGAAMVVAVAAGDRQAIQPLVDALATLKPRLLTVFAGPSAREKTPAIELTRVERGVIRLGTLRKALGGLLLLGLLATSGTLAWAAFEGMGVDSDYEEAQSLLARQRGAVRRTDPVEQAESRLFDRKLQGPVAILVIEELSRILPDDTFLTEMDIGEGKVRFSGLSRDATALIGLVEKSPDFSDAAFFAPTTRTTTDTRERFHIEAAIRPRGDRKS